jgi:uncharacterized protein YegP (UPF0339 family)
MRGFEPYLREDGKWGWRLFATNGQELANDAGQGFRDEFDAKRAIRTVILAVQDVTLFAFDEKNRREIVEAAPDVIV